MLRLGKAFEAPRAGKELNDAISDTPPTLTLPPLGGGIIGGAFAGLAGAKPPNGTGIIRVAFAGLAGAKPPNGTGIIRGAFVGLAGAKPSGGSDDRPPS